MSIYDQLYFIMAPIRTKNQIIQSDKNMDQQPTAKNSVIGFIIIEYTPQRFISAAIYNDRRRVFQIASFNDNEHYTNLQSLLIQTNPHQLDDSFFMHVLIKTDIKSEKEKIQGKFENIQHKFDVGKATHGDISLALQNLLVNQTKFYLKVMEDKKGMHALERLLGTLKLQQDETNRKKFQLQKFNFDKYMRLDQPAINALQIFPKDMQKKILAGTNTIFQILNKCKTHIGTRCLKRWMRQPLQNADQINQRLDKVSFFLRYPAIKNTIQNQLKKLPDLDNLYYTFYKVEAGKKNNVEVNDLIKIYRTVHTMKQLLTGLSQSGSSHPEIVGTIAEIQRNVKIMGTIVKMIEDNVIMEGSRQSQFHVRSDAQKELSVIAHQQSKINKQIREHIEQVKRVLDVQVDKLPSATYKWVLQSDKKKSIDLVKQQSDYKYLTSKQNKITFTTQTLVSLCKSLTSLQEEYKQKQKDILMKMYKVVAGYFPIMEQLSIILSQLDVLTTFSTVINASVGADTAWCRPQFGSSLKGTKIHHPCVRTCIPNDCDMSNNKTVILTGPNMGGKSTYIRTIGLATYLAHIGCYVPAKQFQTTIIDSIITRVGASDMQMKGISTFMSEMIESITMLQSATNRSLVLIDQLGRGTSTSEGFGIAWAICHELHTKIKPYCLFATHFHEMTKMADQLDGVCNMYTSCKITEDKLHLQYKVLPGKMEKSYGIQVAKMLHFPQKIIKDAEEYLDLYEQKTPHSHSSMQAEQAPLTQSQKQAISLYKEMKYKIKQIQSKQQIKIIKTQYKEKIRQVLEVN